MTAVEYPSHDFYASHNVPYASSLTSTATASVCSDAPSQFSGFYDSATTTFNNDLSKCYQPSDGANGSWTQDSCKPLSRPAVSSSLRLNPRRTSSTATTRTGCPPPLVRQAERKLNFVDNLVGKLSRPSDSLCCRALSKFQI